MADTEKLVEQLSALSVLEIAGLVKQLEEKWGVSAAAPVAVAPAPTGGGGAAGAPVDGDDNREESDRGADAGGDEISLESAAGRAYARYEIAFQLTQGIPCRVRRQRVFALRIRSGAFQMVR